MAGHGPPHHAARKGGGAVALYVAAGGHGLGVTWPGGGRGDGLNPPVQNDPEVAANIHEIRAAEMEAAREILGVKQAWLGFVDSGLPQGDPLPPLPAGCFALVPTVEGAAPLVKLMREFRPHVVTTYNEEGGYPHPEHTACHEVSVAAFEAAGDPELYPDLGEPWQPLKLYYDVAFSKEKTIALHEAALAAGIESPYAEWLERWKDRASRTITTRVPCADYFPKRDQALLAHATQVDPEGFFFKMPMELQQATWPTEDFELARSLVDTTIPEDDLFAGVRDRVCQS